MDLSFNVATGRVLNVEQLKTPSGGTLATQGPLSVTEQAFASLPASPPVGTLANISDSTVATVGSTVAGGGTNHVLARWNGTAWKVVA